MLTFPQGGGASGEKGYRAVQGRGGLAGPHWGTEVKGLVCLQEKTVS